MWQQYLNELNVGQHEIEIDVDMKMDEEESYIQQNNLEKLEKIVEKIIKIAKA